MLFFSVYSLEQRLAYSNLPNDNILIRLQLNYGVVHIKPKLCVDDKLFFYM